MFLTTQGTVFRNGKGPVTAAASYSVSAARIDGILTFSLDEECCEDGEYELHLGNGIRANVILANQPPLPVPLKRTKTATFTGAVLSENS
jgi:hypothetical protein